MNDRPLRFLANESCDFGFVRALRQVGYDVTAVVEFISGAPDLKVLELEGRIKHEYNENGINRNKAPSRHNICHEGT